MGKNIVLTTRESVYEFDLDSNRVKYNHNNLGVNKLTVEESVFPETVRRLMIKENVVEEDYLNIMAKVEKEEHLKIKHYQVEGDKKLDYTLESMTNSPFD